MPARRVRKVDFYLAESADRARPVDDWCY